MAAENPEQPNQNQDQDQDQDLELEVTAGPAGASDFFEDAGPEFDPDTVPEAEPDRDLDHDDAGWTADGVANALRDVQAPAFNALLNPLLGVEETDWSHREKRLQQVAPAIAREWNRIPYMKALAGQTDRAVILSYFLLEYFPPRAFDVIEERRQRAREAAELEDEQIVQRGAPTVERQAPGEQARQTGLPPRRR